MAKRGRPSKKKDININSDETRVFFGLLLLVLGILLILGTIASWDGQFFELVSVRIGGTAVILGIGFLLVSVKLFGYESKITSKFFLLTYIVMWVWCLPMSHFPDLHLQ